MDPPYFAISLPAESVDWLQNSDGKILDVIELPKVSGVGRSVTPRVFESMKWDGDSPFWVRMTFSGRRDHKGWPVSDSVGVQPIWQPVWHRVDDGLPHSSAAANLPAEINVKVLRNEIEAVAATSMPADSPVLSVMGSEFEAISKVIRRRPEISPKLQREAALHYKDALSDDRLTADRMQSSGDFDGRFDYVRVMIGLEESELSDRTLQDMKGRGELDPDRAI